MGEERELYEIRHQMECIFDVLQRLAAAADRLVPEGSERDRIALALFVHSEKLLPARCYELADQWIKERTKQRVQQAEQGRTE